MRPDLECLRLLQIERVARTDPEELEGLRWPAPSSMVQPLKKAEKALEASSLCLVHWLF